MKVQLSGKEYVSNLVGLGFEPMLPHFFYQLSTPDGGGRGGPMWWRGRGGGPTWKRRGVAEPCGGGQPTG
jgi:hypothetical protein